MATGQHTHIGRTPGTSVTTAEYGTISATAPVYALDGARDVVMRCAASGGTPTYVAETFTGVTTFSIAFEIIIHSVPTAAGEVLQTRNNSAKNGSVLLHTTRQIQVRTGSDAVAVSSPPLELNTRYVVRAAWTVATTTTGKVTASIEALDGTVLASGEVTTANNGTASTTRYHLGKNTSAPTSSFDLDNVSWQSGAYTLLAPALVIFGDEAATITVSGSGTGGGARVGAGSATATLSASSSSASARPAARIADLAITATGDGAAIRSSSAEAHVSISAGGDGAAARAGARVAALTLSASGVGSQPEPISGAGTATVTISGSGQGAGQHAGASTASVVLGAADVGTGAHSGSAEASGILEASHTSSSARSGSAEAVGSLTTSATALATRMGVGTATVLISATGVGDSGDAWVDLTITLVEALHGHQLGVGVLGLHASGIYRVTMVLNPVSVREMIEMKMSAYGKEFATVGVEGAPSGATFQLSMDGGENWAAMTDMGSGNHRILLVGSLVEGDPDAGAIVLAPGFYQGQIRLESTPEIIIRHAGDVLVEA